MCTTRPTSTDPPLAAQCPTDRTWIRKQVSNLPNHLSKCRTHFLCNSGPFGSKYNLAEESTAITKCRTWIFLMQLWQNLDPWFGCEVLLRQSTATRKHLPSPLVLTTLHASSNSSWLFDHVACIFSWSVLWYNALISGVLDAWLPNQPPQHMHADEEKTYPKHQGGVYMHSPTQKVEHLPKVKTAVAKTIFSEKCKQKAWH